MRLHRQDIREVGARPELVADAQAVFPLAAQTSVRRSLEDPAEDFDVNARATLELLAAVRRHNPPAPVVHASSSAVYGDLADIPLEAASGRCLPVELGLRAHGLAENRPLDFLTPHACSKGAADQYVRDHARCFGMRTAVLRMSSVYGPRQDPGEAARFLRQALGGNGLVVAGEGSEVRDLLHVSDAVAACRAVLGRIDEISGRVFNLGGGTDNAVSLDELLSEIGRLAGRRPGLVRAVPPPGGPRYFVADTRRLEEATGWRCKVRWRCGRADMRDRMAGQAPEPKVRCREIA